MKKFDFTYKDNEGDLYQSDEYNSLREAKQEVGRLRIKYQGDFELVETWIYVDGEFKGRW